MAMEKGLNEDEEKKLGGFWMKWSEIDRWVLDDCNRNLSPSTQWSDAKMSITSGDLKICPGLSMQNSYLVQGIPQLSFHLLYHLPHINKMPISYSKSYTRLHIEPYSCNTELECGGGTHECRDRIFVETSMPFTTHT
jgi:hypothetical protein